MNATSTPVLCFFALLTAGGLVAIAAAVVGEAIRQAAETVGP